MAGTFNQSLQCTQDVFVGFQTPLPPVADETLHAEVGSLGRSGFKFGGNQGSSLEAINVCCQLVGMVGTGIYHSMADVQYTVRSNCGFGFGFPLIDFP